MAQADRFAHSIDNCHAKTATEILVALHSNADVGLSQQEADQRLSIHGRNALRMRKPVNPFRLLLNQFENPVVWLLSAAALVAFVFGEWQEGTAVLAVLVINAGIGFITEMRAMRSMEALRALGNLTTRVRRDGRALPVAAEELVPGDIVILEGGDIVAADLRLVKGSNLSVDESALTGESVPVSKSSEPVSAECVIGDRSSMIFKGTAITRGSGIGVVVATGMQSELGQISRLVEEAAPEHSPLERQLERLSGQLVWFTLLIVTLIGVVGVFAGRAPYLMIESAIALAVAAIPEGLPIVATMALARGMWRMARKNALIERLSAVETLGATTVIFTDKTGTLTENNMRLRELDLPDGFVELNPETSTFVLGTQPINIDQMPAMDQALKALILCNNAELGADQTKNTGDPLELAFLEAGLLVGRQKADLLLQYPRVGEVAFDSESKKMATVHQDGDAFLVCVKGAPETLLDHSTQIAVNGSISPLDQSGREQWLVRTNEMAARGMRVLAVASKHTADRQEDAYDNLTFLGLLGLYDPPRPDVREAIEDCQQAGIRVLMITGDHAVTAKSIATTIGIAGEEDTVMEGRNLKPAKDLSVAELKEIRRATVFARVSPAQKLELVSIYQADGEIVAMTGDGVNDAPALKKADIGIAMGLRGTQVAREAAVMVLRDDAFATIISAIREGRVIFRNIQRFVMYLLSCNLSEVLVVGMAILVGLPLPLLPLQILFLNLVTDVFPAFALGLGEEGEHVLRSEPRDPRKPIFTGHMWVETIAYSLSITLATLGALAIARLVLLMDKQEAVTVSFLTLALAQLWHVFNMRDRGSNWISNAVTRNYFIWAALALSGGLLLAAVYLPSLAAILQLSAPTGQAWLLILTMSALPLVFGQVGKMVSVMLYRRKKGS
ncbi:MAG: cation-transporting P-type ATPase [Rhizobiaceae bacterium]|nr:cation-transporting P-type ATPase [Rhizobiaceae bacterium]